MRCGFCNHQFTEEDAEASCSRCALFGGCRFLRCPSCGYEMPRTPGLLKILQRWAARRTRNTSSQAGTPPELPLALLGTGSCAVVLSIDDSSTHERSKLMALGIVPGVDLRLIQKFPSYVVTVGFTQLALDKETAGLIHVRRRQDP